jgi:hypothetical protein
MHASIGADVFARCAHRNPSLAVDGFYGGAKSFRLVFRDLPGSATVG